MKDRGSINSRQVYDTPQLQSTKLVHRPKANTARKGSREKAERGCVRKRIKGKEREREKEKEKEKVSRVL